MKNIDLNLLKVFEALIEEGNATRAAVQLGVSQAAVSASLARLRRTYDDVLFTRAPGGLEPTDKALEIRPHISEALISVSNSLSLNNEINVQRNLKIGLSDDIEIAFGREIIKTIRFHFPKSRPIFKRTHELFSGDMLRDRDIDIALGSDGLTGKGLKRQSIGETGYLTISNFLPQNERKFTLDEFLEYEHILTSSNGLIGRVDEELSIRGLKRKIAVSTSNFSALKYLLLGTKFIATIPSHSALILSRTDKLFVSQCPLEIKPYPIEVGILEANLKDTFYLNSLNAITDCMAKKNNQLSNNYAQKDSRAQKELNFLSVDN